MDFVIMAVGHPRAPGVKEGIREYERRAAHYFRLRVIEVPAADLPDSARDRARALEGTALLDQTPDGLEVCALSRHGDSMDSRGLAAYLEQMATYGLPGVAFLVGGAHGLSAEVLERAQRRLSLSPLTLPHEMARLVLTEQLYRAGTILRAEPYHKGT